MRILMLDNEFPPLGGGTGVVNYHLLQELSQYPFISVDLITSSRNRKGRESERLTERIMIYKVPVDNRNIHHATNRELLRYTRRGFWLGRALLKQQKYHLSFAFAGVPAGGISYALKKLTGLPYLVSLQGPDVPGFEARYNYLYPVLKPVLRRIWSQAAVVTALSKHHQALAHQTMPGLNIDIIHNGVDLSKFYPAVTSPQNAAINILCVGRLIERKGQQYLLHALARLQTEGYSAHLTLVGTGDAEAELRYLAATLGISEAVTFTGYVPHHEMLALYHQADIFALPSQNEGMSIALLEAMAAGLPVIVTATGGTTELVQPGQNGYVVPWANVPELTTALGMLGQDACARRRMGRESQRLAAQFSWSTLAHEYVKLCRQIANQQDTP